MTGRNTSLRAAAEQLLDRAEGQRPSLGQASPSLLAAVTPIGSHPDLDFYLAELVPSRTYTLVRGGDRILGTTPQESDVSFLEEIQEFPQSLALAQAGFVTIALDAGGNPYAFSMHDGEVYDVDGDQLPYVESLDEIPESGPITEDVILEWADSRGDLLTFLLGLYEIAEHGYPD